jgi:hypothetical protein
VAADAEVIRRRAPDVPHASVRHGRPRSTTVDRRGR